MTPDSQDWHFRMANRWQARAAELRAVPDRCAQVRAAVLETIVADLRGRIAAASAMVAVPTAPPAAPVRIDPPPEPTPFRAGRQPDMFA